MTNWPDEARPGVPLNPEEDGWHWLQRSDGFAAPYVWKTAKDPRNGSWHVPPDWEVMPEDRAIISQRYLGPCLTPSEVAAREQAAYRQGWSDREDDFIAGTERSGLVVMSPQELAAREQAARREGMEEAARIAARAGRPVGAGDGDTYIPGTSADAAAAIRAAAKEPGHA
jgi:hypothetical protein